MPFFHLFIATTWINFEVLILFFQIVKQIIKAQTLVCLIQQQKSKKKLSAAGRSRVMQIFTLNQHMRIEVFLEMHLQMALYNLPAAFLMNVVSSLLTSRIIYVLIEVKTKKSPKCYVK